MRRYILYKRTRSEMLSITFCCHCCLITKQHSTRNAKTKAEMWYGKMPCVPYQLQEWYDICRVCRIGAGAIDVSNSTPSAFRVRRPSPCASPPLKLCLAHLLARLRRWRYLSSVASYNQEVLSLLVITNGISHATAILAFSGDESCCACGR